MTVPYIFANQTGNIALSELDANFANVKASSDTAGTVTASAQPVITSVGQLTSLTVSGNIRTLSGGMYAPAYYYPNGVSILSSLASITYGNSNVAVYLPTYTGALTSLTGNVSTTAYVTALGGIFSGPITASGNIQGGNIVTNGVINASRTISAGNLVANGAVTGYTLQATVGGITAFGNIAGGNITTAGNVVATQRVQAAAFLTGGTIQGSDLYSTGPLRGGYVITSGNLTVGTSASIGTNLSASGNVSANYFIGNGSQLTGITTTSSQAADKLTGNILSGNVIYSSLKTVGNLTSLGVDTTILAQGNITTASNLVASGNVIGSYIFGNGSQLTGINLSPSQDANLLTGSILSSNVAQSSLTTLGTLTSLTVSGAASISGTTSLQNVTATSGTYSSQLVGATITSPGEIRGASLKSNGAISGSNLSTSGAATISGALTVSGSSSLQSVTASAVNSANVIASGTIQGASIVSNSGITSGFAVLTGNLFALGAFLSGNVTAEYLLGNGALLTGTYSNSSVASYLPTYSGALNPSAITASGNITGQYLLGNGALLSGISTTNSLINGTSNVVVSPNGNITMSANATSSILTVVNANLGWNVDPAQVIVEGTFRSTAGLRSTSLASRSNVYSLVNDGPIDGGSLTISASGFGNGNIIAANGLFAGSVSANYFVGNGFLIDNVYKISNGNSNVVVTNNGNVNISANGTANILTVVNANLGWNVDPVQVIVEGTFRSTAGIRTTSLASRSNVYSLVNDGPIDGGSLTISASGFGNGNVTANGVNSGNVLFLNAVNGVQISSASPFRLPSMTNAQRNAFPAAAGDMIWNTDTSNVQVYTGSTWGNITLS